MEDYHVSQYKDNPTILQNRSRKHVLSGIDNQAFLSEPYTITSNGISNNPMSNHLVYRRDQNIEEIYKEPINIYSSSVKSNFYFQNDEITEPNFSVGSSIRGDFANGSLGNSLTLERRFKHTNFVKPNAFSTISARYFKTPGFLSIRRPALGKSGCVSFFDIETDKVPSFQYRPGEDVTGSINIIVHRSLQIKFVELVVSGQGEMRIRQSDEQSARTYRETYLHKEKCFIGDRDSGMSSLLTPGFYTSRFRIKLPADLPSTVHHDDPAERFTYSVSYSLKVRICDDAVSASSRRALGHYRKFRVFMEKQILFNVQRGFDLSVIPDAMAPIIHMEQVYLACSHQEPAVVTVNIDRAVFLAGDSIRVQLLVSLPSSHTVKDISCTFQQHITISNDREPIIIALAKIIHKDPSQEDDKPANPRRDKNFEVTIPTRINLVSPYTMGCSSLKLEYFLAISVRFTPVGGKLFLKIPIGIGPCAEPIYAEKTSSRKAIPLFNRTMRFPCFSTKGTTPILSSLHPSTIKSAASVSVTTKYTNGFFARTFLCCLGVGA